MEIDRSRNVAITSLMKDYATFSNEIAYSLHNVGFIDSSDIAAASSCWAFARITNM